MSRKTPLCADRTCPMAWAEHDAHDGRQSRTTNDGNCTDPTCDMT